MPPGLDDTGGHTDRAMARYPAVALPIKTLSIENNTFVPRIFPDHALSPERRRNVSAACDRFRVMQSNSQGPGYQCHAVINLKSGRDDFSRDDGLDFSFGGSSEIGKGPENVVLTVRMRLFR